MFVSPLIRSEAATDLLTLARNIVCMFVCVGFFSQDDDPRIHGLTTSSWRAEFPAPNASRHGKLPLSVFQISPTNVLREPITKGMKSFWRWFLKISKTTDYERRINWAFWLFTRFWWNAKNHHHVYEFVAQVPMNRLFTVHIHLQIRNVSS